MKRRNGLPTAIVVAASIAAVAFAGLVRAADVPASAATRPTTPKAWDPQILPIVEQVQKIRGLDFEHPVAVEYLDDAAFEKRVGVDESKLSKSERRSVDRSEAQLRAVGLIPPDTDLLGSIDTLQQSGVLAYYDPDTKRVTVRGKTLDVPTKVTLAHELTHALDDQHFDLAAVERAAGNGGSDATRALIEGDAVVVQRAYVKSLSAADRKAYDESASDGERDFTDDAAVDAVPDALSTLFQSPYALGPELVQFVISAKDAHAVDDLFRSPPRDDLAELDPASVLENPSRLSVDAPKLASGEVKVGKSEPFGAFALYLVLSSAMDPVDALQVVLTWRGDRMVTFKRSGDVCVRAQFVGEDRAATAKIQEALVTWASVRQPSATVDADGAGFTACDDGSSSAAPENSSLSALVTATLRSQFLSELITIGPTSRAVCTADATIADPTFRPYRDAFVADPSATPDADVVESFQRRLPAIARGCGLT